MLQRWFFCIFRRCATWSCSTEPCTGFSSGTSIRAPTGSQLTGSKTNRKKLSTVNDQAQPEAYPERAFEPEAGLFQKSLHRKQDFRKEHVNRKQDYWNMPAIRKPGSRETSLLYFLHCNSEAFKNQLMFTYLPTCIPWKNLFLVHCTMYILGKFKLI